MCVLVTHESLVKAAELISEHTKMAQRGAKAAYKVEEQEALRAPYIFQYTPEHPEGEHIEKDVGKAAVHEHMRDELPPAEQRRLPVMQCKDIVDINALHTEGVLQQKNQGINNNEVLYYHRQWLKAARPEIYHDTKIE